MSNQPWTDEETDIARNGWERGSTAASIAGKLPGRTRNAVIGLAHRHGWVHPGRQGPRETSLATELLEDLPTFEGPATIMRLSEWYGEEPSRVASAVRHLFLSGQIVVGAAA